MRMDALMRRATAMSKATRVTAAEGIRMILELHALQEREAKLAAELQELLVTLLCEARNE